MTWIGDVDELKAKLKANTHTNDKGCWLWEGGGDRYGETTVNYKNYSTHRLTAILYLGLEEDSSLVVRHKCDIPKCINPEHLLIGTQSQNIHECVHRGRHPKARQTHCKNGHEFNIVNTKWVKNNRQCRVCNKNYMRKKFGYSGGIPE